MPLVTASLRPRPASLHGEFHAIQDYRDRNPKTGVCVEGKRVWFLQLVMYFMYYWPIRLVMYYISLLVDIIHSFCVNYGNYFEASDIQKSHLGPGEMAQRISVPATKPGDLSFNLLAHRVAPEGVLCPHVHMAE